MTHVIVMLLPTLRAEEEAEEVDGKGTGEEEDEEGKDAEEEEDEE